MRVWEGHTPGGLPLVVERDERGRWVVTVAAVSRSRNHGLETALVEAGGTAVPREWAERLAERIRLSGWARGDVARAGRKRV